MSNNFGTFTLASMITLTGCSLSNTENHGFGVTVLGTTMYNTQKKAMFIVDKKGTIHCSKNFKQLGIVSKINRHSSDGFEQLEGNSAGKNNSNGIQVYRTNDKRYTTVTDSSGNMIMWIENVRGNGTQQFETKQEFDKFLEICNHLDSSTNK